MARLIAAAESNVQNRRTIAFDDRNRTAGRLPPALAQADGRHAERQVAVLRIAVLGMMARRAGYVLGSRQKRVPEQQLSQSSFCLGRRVICRRLRSRRQRRSHTLPKGGNCHVKEYGDRSCCDQQSGKVFRFEQKFTDLTFRHCCFLSHALLGLQYNANLLRMSNGPTLCWFARFFRIRFSCYPTSMSG